MHNVLEAVVVEEFALVHEAEIRRPQIVSSRCVIGERRLKTAAREVLLLPVAFGDAVAMDPDLAGVAVGQRGARLGSTMRRSYVSPGRPQAMTSSQRRPIDDYMMGLKALGVDASRSHHGTHKRDDKDGQWARGCKRKLAW